MHEVLARSDDTRESWLLKMPTGSIEVIDLVGLDEIAKLKRAIATLEGIVITQNRLLRNIHEDPGIAPHLETPYDDLKDERVRRAFDYVSDILEHRAQIEEQIEANRRQLRDAEAAAQELAASSRAAATRRSHRVVTRQSVTRRPAMRNTRRSVARVAAQKSASADSGDGPAEPPTLRRASKAAGGAS